MEKVAKRSMYDEIVFSVQKEVRHSHISKLKEIPYPKNRKQNSPRYYFSDVFSQLSPHYKLCYKTVKENTNEACKIANFVAKPKGIREIGYKHRSKLDCSFRPYSIHCAHHYVVLEPGIDLHVEVCNRICPCY